MSISSPSHPGGAPPRDEDPTSHWEQTFALSSRGISVTDPRTGIMLSVNPAFAAMHGGAVADFVGRHIAMTLTPEWAAKVPALADWVEQKGHVQTETDHVRLDGTVFPASAEAILTRSSDGRSLRRIAWFEDLTQRRVDQEAHREATEAFETAFAQAPLGVALIAMDGRMIRVNGALCRMLGRPEDELLGSTTPSYTHPEDHALSAAAYEHLRRTGESLQVEKRYLRPDGQVVWAATQGNSVRGPDGRPRYIVAHFMDVTDRKRSEQREAEAQARFEGAFAAAPIGMALVGLDGRWLKVNRTLCELTGYPEAQLLGKGFNDVTHPDDLTDHVAPIERLLAGDIERHSMEKRYITAEGRQIWVNVSVSLIRGADGAPLHFVAQTEDISERKRLETELLRLAERDPLTNLWNRRRFAEELDRQIDRGRRYDERAALIALDLNAFKPVNDEFGHAIGDELLQCVARALKTRLRSSDSVARLGGDEFAVILANVSPDEAARIADQLRAAVAACRFEAEGCEVSVSASVGIAFLDRDTPGADAATARADAAMYDDKAARRGPAATGDRAAAVASRARKARRMAGTGDAADASLRILHCDDSDSYRRLVAEMLTVRPGLQVVAEAANAEAAWASAVSDAPDVILLDASLGDPDGRLLARLRQAAPDARIIALSGLEPEASPLRDLVDAFVPKSASFDQLDAAVRAAQVVP